MVRKKFKKSLSLLEEAKKIASTILSQGILVNKNDELALPEAMLQDLKVK